MQAREVQPGGVQARGRGSEPLPHLPPSPLSYPFLAGPPPSPAPPSPAPPRLLLSHLHFPSPAPPVPAPPWQGKPWRVPRRLRAFLL